MSSHDPGRGGLADRPGMINVISAGSPVIESSYVELEDGKAKMQSCLYFKKHRRFSMCGTHMRSMNESVVTTMLVVQPMSRVRNPMAVLSMMIGDIWYKVTIVSVAGTN